MEENMFDTVNHPRHYNLHPSGIECIEITRLCQFDMGNAVKYIWRHADKNGDEDLRKARFYLKDLLATGQASHPPHKAKVLLQRAIEADHHPIRGNLLGGILSGRIEGVIRFITSLVGEEDV
jgi:hypothetical protein